LDWLSHRADARMTGSGAGVFASFASESDAAATLQQVPAQWRAWKAKALAEHPMAHLLPS
jgi:4-diphosphocytidyl-2-C-methyl-D-erythritol kinase